MPAVHNKKSASANPELSQLTFPQGLAIPQRVGDPGGTINYEESTPATLDILDKGYEPLDIMIKFLQTTPEEEEFRGANAMRVHLYRRLHGQELRRYACYLNGLFNYCPNYKPLRGELHQAIILHELRNLPALCKFFDENQDTQFCTIFNPRKILSWAFNVACAYSYRSPKQYGYRPMFKSVKKALDRLSWETVVEAAERGWSTCGRNAQWAEISYRNRRSHPQDAGKQLKECARESLIVLAEKPVLTRKAKAAKWYFYRYEKGDPIIRLVANYRACQVPTKTTAAILRIGLRNLSSSSDPEDRQALKNFRAHLPGAYKHAPTNEALKLLPEEI